MSFAPSPVIITKTPAPPLVGRDALLAMLTYKRPHGSKAERAFIRRFILPHIDYQDEAGNLIKAVGDRPSILWSSHTDTVHRQGGRQTLEITDDQWVHSLSNDCLGADCAAGVWLMLEMIRAGVPGLYVFHREEESGGRGSMALARRTPERLDGIQAAIAFDRKGFTSVITHQFGDRCCSNAFASSLADILGEHWALDDTGTFTDTANYTDLVGECTNISVGYLDQHQKTERQHLGFLECLRDILVSADWSRLVIARKPGERDERDAWDVLFRPSSRVAREDLLEAIRNHPEAVADILEDYAITADEILDAAYRQ